MQLPFIVEQEPTVRWPVTVRLPKDGRHEVHQFTGLFRVYSESEFADLIPAREPDEKRTLVQTLADNAVELPRFLVGWEGVRQPNGTELPISALPGQITGPYGLPLSKGLWQAINEIRYGIEPDVGATLGNSAASQAGGPPPDGEAAPTSSQTT